MKLRRLFLIALVLLLAAAAALEPALAYFSTYARAQGGLTIALGEETEIYERLSRWTKHISVTSEPGSRPVFVRVKVFWGAACDVSFDGGGSWTEGADGYWYCSDILYEDAQTPELDIHIDNVPADAEPGDSFSVVVIYETTPALYEADGAARADWSILLDTGTTGGADA